MNDGDPIIPKKEGEQPTPAVSTDPVETAFNAFGQSLKNQKAKKTALTQLLAQQDQIKEQVVTAAKDLSVSIGETQKLRIEFDKACEAAELSHTPSEDGTATD